MAFSTVVRRLHMYLALGLFPWMLMYALSTLAMNHRESLARLSQPGAPPFVVERTFTFSPAAGASVEDAAREVLVAAGLDGTHTARRRNDGAIVVTRAGLVTPARVTYTPADGQVTVERQEYRTPAFLERFHRRRGYDTGYGLDSAWAVTVDLAIVAMLFWALSGLWMWWEMKATRGLGALAVLGGAGLFALYLMTI